MHETVEEYVFSILSWLFPVCPIAQRLPEARDQFACSLLLLCTLDTDMKLSEVGEGDGHLKQRERNIDPSLGKENCKRAHSSSQDKVWG